MKPLPFALLVFLSLAMPTRAQAEQFYFVIVDWPSTGKWEAPALKAPADAKLLTKAYMNCANKTSFTAKGKDEKYVLDIALNLTKAEPLDKKSVTITFLFKTPDDTWSFAQEVMVKDFMVEPGEARILCLAYSPSITRAVLLWISP
jgi:hypothetical protein